VNLAVSDLADGLLRNGSQRIAAVRAKVPGATEAEILAAVRYEGAYQIREVEQINRHLCPVRFAAASAFCHALNYFGTATS